MSNIHKQSVRNEEWPAVDKGELQRGSYDGSVVRLACLLTGELAEDGGEVVGIATETRLNLILHRHWNAT